LKEIESNMVLGTKCLKTNHEGTKQVAELESPLRDYAVQLFVRAHSQRDLRTTPIGANMSVFRRCAVVKILMMLGMMAFVPHVSGQVQMEAPPTTAPATRPAAVDGPPVAADSTTPQGTLMVLSRAAASGETTDARELFHTANARQSQVADAMLEKTRTDASFRKTVVNALGEEAAKKIVGDAAADAAESESRIRAAEVKIQGSKATVDMGDRPVTLVQVDGKWKVPVADLVEGMSEADVDQTTTQVKIWSTVVKQVTDEVNGGKYKTADEVQDALMGKLATAQLQAATEKGPTGPGTQPATMPTREPAP
jgi:hypothetical protein